MDGKRKKTRVGYGDDVQEGVLRNGIMPPGINEEND
jgi:hypothetical protein